MNHAFVLVVTEETAKLRRAATMELEEQLELTPRDAMKREPQVHDLEMTLEAVQSELESEREQHGKKLQEIQDASQENDDSLVDMERRLTESSLCEKSTLKRSEERQYVFCEAQTKQVSERSRRAVNPEDQIRADAAIFARKIEGQ